MELEDVKRATDLARERILKRYPACTQARSGNDEQHLLWMCDEAEHFMEAGRREKARHWLGFIQGSLYSRHYATIEEMAAVNRAETEAAADARS